MTKERQLLKEAAHQLDKLLGTSQVDIRSERIENDIIMMRAKINAHLSQPDAVAMTWEEARIRVAKKYGAPDWATFFTSLFVRGLTFDDLREEIIKAENEVFCLFMESNRVQSRESKPAVNKSELEKARHRVAHLKGFQDWHHLSAKCEARKDWKFYADSLNEAFELYLEGNK